MKKAAFYQQISGTEDVTCSLCSHRCRIGNGQHGICVVRKNHYGTLFSNNYGYIIAKNDDPIEKKPLYHVLPGSKTFSIAAPGCNFKCRFCQNWEISQVSENRNLIENGKINFSPEKLVSEALQHKCETIAFTYTEPTVYYELMKDVSEVALDRGVRCVVVSNGYMTSEVLETLHPLVSAYNIDLKAFSDTFYRKNCSARLEPVLNTIRKIADLGIWIEITTLLIPNENDTLEEISKIASFIASINTEIPWHISRFFPCYQFTDHSITPDSVLAAAYSEGKKRGLKHIYIGNTSATAITYCDKCGNELITRNRYTINKNISISGKCPNCSQQVPGIFV